jgi:nucleoside-diphosphate-sugar epimerase
MSSTLTLSIFGSTGGTGLAILRQCLNASYQCTVLVRNPSKLLTLLSISDAPPNLTIVTGSIQDTSAVQRALLTSDGKLVHIVVSCIGFVPSLTLNKKSLNPFANVDDVHICENGTKTILSSIEEVKQQHSLDTVQGSPNPLLVVLSTTGITTAGRDLPVAMKPLYGIMGPPHKDKKAMEDFLHSAAVLPSQPWIVIRPSLLMGDGKGEPKGKVIKVGVEKNGKHQQLAIGYRIQREDVGYWIFKNVVEGDWEQWNKSAVTLTY